jgi:ParB family transcriptional regulator, chromosome partitioning protein
MAKDKDILQRFGANLAESMGAGRATSPATPVPSAMGKHDGVSRLRAAAEIEVGRIVADPEQPRTEFDPGAIARLAESLKSHGQIQPISVRWSDDMGRYLIVTGERRWRASILAGRPTIAAVILEGERTESQVLEMQLVENCLREDLQPIEQARAFRTLMDRNDWTAARLAEALQLTGASVTRALALLDLPYTVQEAVASGELAPSVAYEVSKLADPDAQAEIAARVVAEGLSRVETVEAVRQVASKLTRTAGSKGRGASKGKPNLPSEHVVKLDAGFKVIVSGRKGFDLATRAHLLKEALEQTIAKIDPAEQGGETAAA